MRKVFPSFDLEQSSTPSNLPFPMGGNTISPIQRSFSPSEHLYPLRRPRVFNSPDPRDMNPTNPNPRFYDYMRVQSPLHQPPAHHHQGHPQGRALQATPRGVPTHSRTLNEEQQILASQQRQAAEQQMHSQHQMQRQIHQYTLTGPYTPDQTRHNSVFPFNGLEWPWIHGWKQGTRIDITDARYGRWLRRRVALWRTRFKRPELQYGIGMSLKHEFKKSCVVDINGEEYGIFLVNRISAWNTNNPHDRIEQDYVGSSSSEEN